MSGWRIRLKLWFVGVPVSIPSPTCEPSPTRTKPPSAESAAIRMAELERNNDWWLGKASVRRGSMEEARRLGLDTVATTHDRLARAYQARSAELERKRRAK